MKFNFLKTSIIALLVLSVMGGGASSAKASTISTSSEHETISTLSSPIILVNGTAKMVYNSPVYYRNSDGSFTDTGLLVPSQSVWHIDAVAYNDVWNAFYRIDANSNYWISKADGFISVNG